MCRAAYRWVPVNITAADRKKRKRLGTKIARRRLKSERAGETSSMGSMKKFRKLGS